MGDQTMNVTILCGSCRVPVEHDTDAEQVQCPECGKSETADRAVAIAGEYTTDAMQLQLNKRAKKMVDKSSMMTFSGSIKMTRSYEYITDLPEGIL